jgi:hypothetical protein
MVLTPQKLHSKIKLETKLNNTMKNLLLICALVLLAASSCKISSLHRTHIKTESSADSMRLQKQISESKTDSAAAEKKTETTHTHIEEKSKVPVVVPADSATGVVSPTDTNTQIINTPNGTIEYKYNKKTGKGEIKGKNNERAVDANVDKTTDIYQQKSDSGGARLIRQKMDVAIDSGGSKKKSKSDTSTKDKKVFDSRAIVAGLAIILLVWLVYLFTTRGINPLLWLKPRDKK